MTARRLPILSLAHRGVFIKTGQEHTPLMAGVRNLMVSADTHVHLGALWFRESNVDWIISKDGVRRLFEEFVTWAETPR